MACQTIAKAVRYANQDAVHVLTFTVDLNKPMSKATDVMQNGTGRGFMYYRNLPMTPECASFEEAKLVTMERCLPIDWKAYRMLFNFNLRGVILCRQHIASPSSNLSDWASLYEELGPMAGFVELILYLASIYGKDPELNPHDIEMRTEEVVTWIDCEKFEYTFKADAPRHRVVYRAGPIDPERYV